MDVGPSPQLWSRWGTLFIESTTRKFKNVGRKIRGYIMINKLKLPKIIKKKDVTLGVGQQLGKSNADRKAR